MSNFSFPSEHEDRDIDPVLISQDQEAIDPPLGPDDLAQLDSWLSDDDLQDYFRQQFRHQLRSPSNRGNRTNDSFPFDHASY